MTDARKRLRAERILIYGVTGSGKTTLAKMLSQIAALPFHSVDDLAWEPGWVMVPQDEQRRRIEEICRQPRWILDTAYSSWIDVPLERAELIICLDYPRWMSFARLLNRTVCRILDKRRICNGNVESLRTLLSSDSILLWHGKSFKRKRFRMRQWKTKPPTRDFLIFENHKKLMNWIDSL